MSDPRFKKHDTTGTPAEVLEARKKLKARMGNKTRTGGKGSRRRTKNTHVKSNATDEKKMINGLKKRFGVTPFPDIEEVNLFKDDNTVIHFAEPEGN